MAATAFNEEDYFSRNVRSPSSAIRNGSFAGIMEKEKLAELEAEYLKLHEMFPEETQVEKSTFFEFDEEQVEEVEEKPKRRPSVMRRLSLKMKMLPSAEPTPSVVPPQSPIAAAAPTKKRGSIFRRASSVLSKPVEKAECE